MAALEAYRQLLRSTRIAFQGDHRLLTAARNEARKGFDSNRYLSPADQSVTAGIAHANDVARILRQNVVQGKQVDKDGDGDGGATSYKLRIHKETERGDNETTKTGSPNHIAGKGCGS